MLNLKKDKWVAEFQKGGIPSSIRTTPSKSLLDFFSFLKRQRKFDGHLIDIGCGKGRNAIYAATQGLQVTAVDWISQYSDAVEMNVAENWQFENETFDLAFDAFCFKHLISMDERKTYIQELARTLKKSGYFALSLSDMTDGYYSQFFIEDAKEKNLILDPGNQIESILYTHDDVMALFSNYFSVVQHQLKTESSMMHGQEYERKVHQFIFVLN